MEFEGKIWEILNVSLIIKYISHIYRLESSGYSSRHFFLFQNVQTGSGTHAVSYPLCREHSFPGGKRPGREVDHLPSQEWTELYRYASYMSSQPWFFNPDKGAIFNHSIKAWKHPRVSQDAL